MTACADPNCDWRIKYFGLLKSYNKNEFVKTIGRLRKKLRRLEEEAEAWRQKEQS